MTFNTRGNVLDVRDLGLWVCAQGSESPLVRLGAMADARLCDALHQTLACRAAHSHAGALFHVDAMDAQGVSKRYLAVELADDALRVIVVRRANDAQALWDFVATVPFAFAILNMFLTHPYHAITVADHEGRMRYISPVHEKFLKLEPGTAIGQYAKNVIPNSRLQDVVSSGKAEIGDLQHFGDHVSRVVNRIPVFEQGRVVGAVGQVSFSGVEALNSLQRRLNQLNDEVQHYKRELHQLKEGVSNTALVGSSVPMLQLFREIDAVARLDVPVLILGESGSGKELVAQALHTRGRKAGSPLITLNLAALPSTLIESELFGYEPGAFTGGKKHGQPGKLEQAEGGTLFLDEVADIPMEIQVKLLRVLEDRQVQRLGANQAKHVNFRIVAATHRDLRTLIDSGRFRLDLFYRLSGVVLQVPPLRQRLEDIPALVHRFTQSFCERNNLPVPRIEPAVMGYLAQQFWPGNVRQLRQRVEEALVFCNGLHLSVANFSRHQDPLSTLVSSPSTPVFGAGSSLRSLERSAVLEAITRNGGNKKRAAHELGISRSYLYKLLNEM